MRLVKVGTGRRTFSTLASFLQCSPSQRWQHSPVISQGFSPPVQPGPGLKPHWDSPDAHVQTEIDLHVAFCWYATCWSLTDAVICYKAGQRADRSLRLPPKETTPLVWSPTTAQRNASSCGHPASLVSAAEPSRLHFGERDAQRGKSALLLFLFTLLFWTPETWRTNRLCTCFPLRYRPQRTSPVFRPLKVRATSKHMKGGRCDVIKHSTKLCLENMCLKSVD